MDKNYLLENENFELDEDLTPDLKATLIAYKSSLTLNETFEKLNQIKPMCSEEVRNGIEQYIEIKKAMLEKAKAMLREGYVLFPIIQRDEHFLYPQILTSIEDFLKIGSNHHYILIKVGEEGLHNTGGFGSVTKNDNNELINVSIRKELMPENMALSSNSLFKKDIKVSHKFKRFDIVRVPFMYGMVVVVDKSDIVGEMPNPIGDGNWKTDLYFCRPCTGWDYNKPYYYEHLTAMHVVSGFYEKVEYEDAPAHIRELVDHLKNDYLAKKGCLE